MLDDDSFHSAAQDNVSIEVDLNARHVKIGEQSWDFELDDMELALVENDGMTASYKKYGREVFEKLTMGDTSISVGDGMMALKDTTPETVKELQW